MKVLWRPRLASASAVAALVLLATTCTTGRGAAVGTPPGGAAAGVTIGAFDFPESTLLAELYGQALRAKGYPVRFALNLGPRELVEPALEKRLIQFVPEYAGSALDFLGLGQQLATADAAATHRALVSAFGGRGILALSPAAAQNMNSIVVTSQTAARYGLHDVSDLERVAPALVFGGPPECPARPLCLQGLTARYGLRFKSFVQLDTGGPLTVDTLAAGQIDVGLLFSTDPSIDARHLVVLSDDAGLQPAENVTPVVSQQVALRYGPAFTAAVDSVSGRLSTDALRSLNGLVTLDGQSPRDVALSWLRSQGLA